MIGIGTFILGTVDIMAFSMINSESTSSLASLSDDELETEREKVRLDYCSSGNSFEKAVQLEKEHPNGVPDAHWTDENRWD